MNKRLLTMARIYKPHVWNVVVSGHKSRLAQSANPVCISRKLAMQFLSS